MKYGNPGTCNEIEIALTNHPGTCNEIEIARTNHPRTCHEIEIARTNHPVTCNEIEISIASIVIFVDDVVQLSFVMTRFSFLHLALRWACCLHAKR